MAQTYLRISLKKSFLLALTIALASTQLALPLATALTPNTQFDGEYSGKLTLTLTTTVPTDPPRKISITQTSDLRLTVRAGKVLEGGNGGTIDRAGNALASVTIPGYGTITFAVHFTRDSSGKGARVSGEMNAEFPAVFTVIVGTYSGIGGEKFSFTIPILHSARIGYPYIPVSLCQPATKKGGLCGLFSPSLQRNPKGGKAPYTFRTKIGSAFLPTGMLLNPFTGLISGTPRKGQKTGPKKMVICAYDSNDGFTGVCRSVTLNLTT